MRKLGIPTVVDRLIQQALHQVMSPIFEPGFSESSYGFRPGRSAQDAVRQARAYVKEGRRWVVDMDLEKFFDRVNHDILMSRVGRRIKDKRVLRLIRRYLQAGMMEGGIGTQRVEGAPQGGPITPPTMLQMAPCGAEIKRELLYSEHDADLSFVDRDSLDERPDDITFGGPIGTVEATGYSRCELLESPNDQGQFRSKCVVVGDSFNLRLQFFDAFSEWSYPRLELWFFNETGVELRLHREARKAFDERGLALVSRVSSRPGDPPQPKGFDPNRYISRTFTPEDIRGEIRVGSIDEYGNPIAKFFQHQDGLVGLMGEDYKNLERLADSIQKTKDFSRTVSRQTLIELVFDWVRDRFREKNGLVCERICDCWLLREDIGT